MNSEFPTDSRAAEKLIEKTSAQFHELHGDQIRAMGFELGPKFTVIDSDKMGKSRMFKHLPYGRVIEIL